MPEPEQHQDQPDQEDWAEIERVLPEIQQPVLPPKRQAGDQATVKLIEALPTREVQPASGGAKVREIGSNREARMRPELPDLRLAGSVDDRQRDDRQREPWELATRHRKESRPGELRWLLLAALGCLLLIIAGLIVLPRIGRAPVVESPDDRPSVQSVREQTLRRDEEMEALVTGQPEAHRLMARYARSALVDDVLPMLSHSKTVEPLVRHVGHRQLADYQWTPGPTAKWQVGIAGSRPYATLSGRFADQSRFTAYFVREEGQLCLDWKATVGYGTANFTDLGEGRGDAGEIRGQLSPDNYYNSTYPEGTFQSYRLQSPDGTMSIWCYVRLNTPLAQELARLFVGGELIRQQAGSALVTVALKRGPEDAMPNQWLISKLLHEEWVEP